MNSKKKITRKNMNISETFDVLLFCEFDSFFLHIGHFTYIYTFNVP